MTKRDQGVTDQDLEQLTLLFRLLSDRTRLGILTRLADGERNVTALCEDLRLPQPTVSHHLALLRMNNLVVNRRRGKQVFYALHGQPEHSALMELAVQNLVVQVRPKGKG